MGNRKLVLVSDTHGHTGNLIVPSGDILLHAGDFSYRGHPTELTAFDDWLDGLDFPKKIIIPGNHELYFEDNWEAAEAYVPAADAILNSSLYETNGLKIWGEPRTPEFCGWAFNVRHPLMKHVWDLVPTDIDVLLTHGPPYGIGDLTERGERVGCRHQLDWIKEHQPKLVVCGHIHGGYGVYSLGNTIIVNASICNPAYKPVNAPIVVHI